MSKFKLALNVILVHRFGESARAFYQVPVGPGNNPVGTGLSELTWNTTS